MDGYEALSGKEDPYIGKLSRRVPYFLFPPDVSPWNLVISLREYHASCLKRHGDELMKCSKIILLTSKKNGYDIVIAFGSDHNTNGILDAFALRPVPSCVARPCCCNLNDS